jgi:hypothetical protein
MEGTAAEGSVSAGRNKGELCKELLECMQRTACGSVAATDCFCGSGVLPEKCFADLGSANGVCHEEVLAATEATGPTDITITARILDSAQYAAGRAVQVLETCDQLFCVNECGFCDAEQKNLSCGASPLGQGGAGGQGGSSGMNPG